MKMQNNKKTTVACLELDVTKYDNVRSEVIVGEAYGSVTKKLLNAIDKCNRVWKNSEKNKVSAKVGLLTGSVPLLLLSSVGVILNNAVAKPLGRVVGFKGIRCKKSDCEDDDECHDEDEDKCHDEDEDECHDEDEDEDCEDEDEDEDSDDEEDEDCDDEDEDDEDEDEDCDEDCDEDSSSCKKKKKNWALSLWDAMRKKKCDKKKCDKKKSVKKNKK